MENDLDIFYFCFGQLRQVIVKIEPRMRRVITAANYIED